MTSAFASTPSVGESKKSPASPVGVSRLCWKKKYVQTVVGVRRPLEAASLTATRMRLLVKERLELEIVTNQRPERRSKRTRGVPTGLPLATEAKNVSMSVSRTPSDVPVVFRKVRMRPLTPSRNCVGPAAPELSGGKAFVSASVAPRKLMPSVWGSRGPGGRTRGAPARAVERADPERWARGARDRGAAGGPRDAAA